MSQKSGKLVSDAGDLGARSSWVLKSVALALGIAGAVPAVAIETRKPDERLVVDWGKMRVTFYGVAGPSDESEDFKKIERRARNEAMTMAKEAVKSLFEQHMKQMNAEFSPDEAAQAANSVVSDPKSLRTEYFSDGRVKIYYESSLAQILGGQRYKFTKKERIATETGMFTGLILRTDGPTPPRASYEVVDETGRVLFSQKDVAEDAFRENLMGRWFQKPSRKDLADAVGPKPISMSFTVDGQGRLVVQGSAWQEAVSSSPAILQNARVAVISP